MTAPCVQSIPRHEIQEALDCIRGLQAVWFRPTNPATERFNCVAWALHDRSRFWWPGGHPGYFIEDDDKPCDYWPVRLTEPDPASNLEHFFRLFADHGFRSCQNGTLEQGVEKVVFYTQSCRGVELFQHAARQLPSGLWTSKLGRLIDLEHTAPQDLCEEYGETLTFLGRPRLDALPFPPQPGVATRPVAVSFARPSKYLASPPVVPADTRQVARGHLREAPTSP